MFGNINQDWFGIDLYFTVVIVVGIMEEFES